MEEQISPIIKPTNGCNLNCAYCFADAAAYKGKMNLETLENSITKPAQFNGIGYKSDFLWHGGEPLIAGLNFFREVIKIQQRLEKEHYEFKNSIQTNGTLINGTWAEFFKENDFSVSLSLDGPKELNDCTRIYRTSKKGDKSTFLDVMNSIDILRARDIDPSVIVTLTKQNIRSVKTIYQFLKKQGINARFNPLLKSGRATKNYQDLGISPEEYLEAKLRLYSTWSRDTEPVHLYCLEDMFKGVATSGLFSECTFSESCQNGIMSIGFGGDVYPCPEFDGEKEFRYGNINTDRLEDILAHPLRKKLLERAKNIEECAGCNQKNLCHGGCMSNAYAFSGNVLAKDPYCLAYSSLFSHISNECKEVIKQNA